MSGSGSDSDVIEFVGTKKKDIIDLLSDTDDENDDKGGLVAAKKAIPVNSISSSNARKRPSSGVARAPSFPSQELAHAYLGNTARAAINLCEERSDAGRTTSRRSGPFATMTYQGRSQEMAIELEDSSSSSSKEEDSDSDASSVIFVDKVGKEIPPAVVLSSRPPDPYDDSSDDEVTTLFERMQQRGHRAHATDATIATNSATAAIAVLAAAATTAPAAPSFTANSPLPRDRDRDQNRKQLREGRRAEVKRSKACGVIPSSPRKKAPASTFLKSLPSMGKSAQALQKSRTAARKVPDVIMSNIPTKAERKSVRTVTEDMPGSSDDEDFELSTLRIRRKKPVLSLSRETHADEKLASKKKSARSEKHAEMEVDNDSVAASDAPTDGSERDGTVCLEEGEDYGDFGVDAFGQYGDDDDDLDQPLDCTFDDDTVVSVRAVAIRPTRKSRRSPSGSDVVDDSIDKENAKFVRRPMVPAATDRRLQAFADYDLVGMRDNKTVVGDDDEDSLPEDLFDNLGIDDCVSMNIVDRLSSLSEDPKTGLPVRRFTVHGGEDDVLHEFEITIKQSGIPGSGLGAFLMYLGARKLTVGRREKGKDAIEEYEHFHYKTSGTLQARTAVGYGYSVTLTGENLHGNNNRSYWPKAMKKAYEEGEDFDREELACQRALPDGIGFLGMHLDSHYKASSKAEFSSQSCLPLGNYGPFQKEDRKTESQFTVKSFIFGNAPNEWPFDVEEKLFGERQIIDITGDETGSPHELARKNIAMYVNEVGHSNKSKQNVFICPRDGRAVQYFIKLDSPMKKGEQIELLTNYGKIYEDIREGKGYGYRNLNRGLASDEEDPALALQRNFGHREDAENAIITLKCPNLVSMIEFVKERIWLPVWSKAQAFHASLNDSASRGDVPPPSREQWIALRRIHWLRSVFLRRVCDLEVEEQLAPTEDGYPYQSSYNYCKVLLDAMEQNRFSVAVESAESFFAIGEALRQEIIEEMHYTMREKLLMPFDRSVWCPLAVELLKMLSDDVSVLLISTKGNPTPEEKLALRCKIIAAAESSANDFRKSAKGGGVSDSLGFRSGIAEGSIISGSLRILLDTVKCSNSFYVDNSTAPKGFLAGIVRMLAYYDSLVLAGVEPQQDDSFQLQLETSKNFVMAQYNGFDGSDKLRELGSLPQVIDSANTSTAVNETWYLVWQLIYVVHTFLVEFLDGSDETLKILCSSIGVDYALAQFAVARGMKHERDKSLRKRCSRKSQPLPQKARKHLGRSSRDLAVRKKTVKKQRKTLSKTDTNCGSAKTPHLKVGSNGRARAKELWYGKPDPGEIPGRSEGWTKRTFQRQSGATKGDTDHYWYTPILEKKLRSLKEVERFIEELATCKGDEEMAWRRFKQR